MAEKDNNPSKKTNSDGAPPKPAPIKHPKVVIDTRPKPNVPGAGEYSDKIDKVLRGEVEKAVEKAAPGGKDAQVDAAKRVVKEAAEKLIDPGKIQRVDGDLSGTVDGKPFAAPLTTPVPELKPQTAAPDGDAAKAPAKTEAIVPLGPNPPSRGSGSKPRKRS